MATRTQQGASNLQSNVRSGSGVGSNRGDGTVFRSTGEFALWVMVVTLILFCLMILGIICVHLEKQSTKTERQLQRSEAILNRLEEKDKKNAKHHNFDGSDADGV